MNIHKAAGLTFFLIQWGVFLWLFFHWPITYVLAFTIGSSTSEVIAKALANQKAMPVPQSKQPTYGQLINVDDYKVKRK